MDDGICIDEIPNSIQRMECEAHLHGVIVKAWIMSAKVDDQPLIRVAVVHAT